MPGCVLHASGSEFDPDGFLCETSLGPYSIWHKGDQVSPVGRRSKQRHASSGFSCDVGGADLRLDGQIQEAIAFLTRHRRDLGLLKACPEIEDVHLDFGFSSQLGGDTFMQGEYLPVEFLRAAADLQIAVALSIYPAR